MSAKKILFVCLGNIIRSPLGEGVFRHLAETHNALDRYHVDSAGTSSYHIGESPDSRMRKTAAAHGLEYDGNARQLLPQDLDEFDLVLAMDRDNERAIRKLAQSPSQEDKIKLMREFDPAADGELDVPDPYYGGQQGFEQTYEIVFRSVEHLFRQLESGSE